MDFKVNADERGEGERKGEGRRKGEGVAGAPPFPSPRTGASTEAARPCRGRLACPRAGAVLEGNRLFEGEWKAKVALAAGAGDKRKAARAFVSGRSGSRSACRSGVGVVARKLPACFEFAHSSFLSDESSGRGKAGAAWGCRPTEHPLPTPAGNPAVFQLAAFRIRSAFRKSRRLGPGRLAMTRSALADAH